MRRPRAHLRRRASLHAIAAALLASPLLLAQAQPNTGSWARFDDASSLRAARPIVASDAPGDAALTALAVDQGMLTVDGRLGLDNGSRWSTLGAEIAPTGPLPDAGMSGASVLRIRLASTPARPLRVRIKGSDREIGNAGCYPIVVQMVAATPTDYLVPLSAFRAPAWCGTRAATIEEALRSIARVEVTANDEPAGAVRFSVGSIAFLADDWSAPDPGWRLAWSDEFDGADGQAPAGADWQTGNGALDGNGNLRLRPQGHARASLRSAPRRPILSGRSEVRLRIPEAATGGRSPRLRIALQPASPGTAAIVLLEGDAAEGFSAGLDGPGSPPAVLAMRTRVPSPLQGRFMTVACEREPGRIRWLVDGIVVQEAGPADLPAAAWAALEQAPLALDLSVDGDGDGAGDGSVAIDAVRLWQRDEPPVASALAPAPPPPAPHGPAPGSAPAASAAPAAKRKPASPSTAAPAQSPPRRVVCEFSARYQLMLCY